MNGIDKLTHKLDAYIKRYYFQRTLRGLLFWLGFSILGFILWSVVEYYGEFGSGFRKLLFWSYFALFSAWLISFVLFPFLRLNKLLRGISYSNAAVRIGSDLNGMDQRILNTLQLSKYDGLSKELAIAAIDQQVSLLEPINFNKLLSFKPILRLSPLLLIPMLLLGLMFGTEGGRKVLMSSERLVYYNDDFEKPAPFTFNLEKAYEELEYGSSYDVKVNVGGDLIPEKLMAFMNGVEYMPIRINRNDWILRVENVQEDIKLHFTAMGFKSEVMLLEVYYSPQVGGVNVEFDFPAYTKIDGIKEPLGNSYSIPEGSEMKLNAVGTDYTEGLKFLGSIDSLDFVEGSLRKPILEDEKFGLLAFNRKSEKQLYSAVNLRVIKDRSPLIIAKMDSLELGSNQRSIFLRMEDDYGLRKLERIVKINGLESAYELTNNPQAEFRDFVDFSALADSTAVVELFYRVWDNDGFNGSKASSTSSLIVSLKTLEEEQTELEQKVESFMSSSESRKQENRKLAKELESVNQKVNTNSKLEWKDKEEIKRLLNELKNNTLKTDKERKELLEDLKKLKDKSPNEKEIEKRLEELSKEELLLKELESEIQELMSGLKKKELQEKLDELKSENKEQLRKEERMDKLLKDLMFQRDLLKEADRLKKLAEELKKLGETEEKDASDLLDKEKSLEEALKKLEDLAKENKMLSKKLESEEFEKTKKDLEEALEKAKSKNDAGQPKEANESEKEASEKSEDLSDSLLSMMMQMQSEADKVNMESLRRILENLKVFSRDIERSGLDIQDLGNDDPRYRDLLQEQSRLLAGSKVIEDSLTLLASRAPQVEDKIFKELKDMQDELKIAQSHLQEREKPQASTKHQFSMMAANNLALMLDEAMQNMMAMMAMKKKGEQNCEKPGNGKPKPGQVAEQISKMGQKVDKLEKGSKDGKGKEGDGKEMSDVLSEQEALRRMLENQEGTKGEGGKPSELLDELDKMEDLLLEEDFDSYKERFKRIETRLLESEKATEERKQKEEREGEKTNGLVMKSGQTVDFNEIRKTKAIKTFNRERVRLNNFYKKLLID